MSQPWKLLPVAAALAVLGALLLTPGGVTQPNPAFAAIDCDLDKGVIQIQLRDLDGGNNPVDHDGIVVRITPDPVDGNGSRDYTDNGNNDDSNTVGTIRENNACASDADDYTAEVVEFPADFDCETVVGEPSFGVESEELTEEEIFVGNCDEGATATPTGTVTGTVGPAATIVTNASPQSVGCSGTSIVTIQVRDADGDPVPAGSAVVINASIGSVSPSSGQTTDASGSAFVFFTAPANQGGTATITATSGSASGQTTVNVNCGTAPTATTAPPPTVAPGGGGVITPPSTGDAGLATESGASWSLPAAVALIALAACGAVAVARVRA